MKINKLKLNKSCNENWNNMSPNENGRFCKLCSKDVIDFTKLKPNEIAQKIKESKGEICAKLTRTQILTPLLDGEKSKEYRLPYSKVAAGVILVASLTSVQSCEELVKTQKTELVSVNPSEASNKIEVKKHSKLKKHYNFSRYNLY